MDAVGKSHGKGSPLLACAGVFVVALIVRLIYLWQSSSNPTFASPIVDAMEYDALARSAAAGKGISLGFFWQPFFYPAFLSGIYSISGSSMLVARIVQLFLGALTCGLTCLLGRRLFGNRIGLVAGLMAALYGPLVFYDCELLGTGLESLLAVILLLLVTGAPASRGGRWWFLLGICGALSVLTRPTFLPFFVVACLWLAIAEYRAGTGSPRLISPLAAVAVAFALLTLPVAWKNAAISGHFSIMPYSGGLNLYIGNNPDTAATIAARPGWAWDRLTLLPKQYGVKPGYDTSTFFSRKVLDYARSAPLAFLRGLAGKRPAPRG